MKFFSSQICWSREKLKGPATSALNIPAFEAPGETWHVKTCMPPSSSTCIAPRFTLDPSTFHLKATACEQRTGFFDKTSKPLLMPKIAGKTGSHEGRTTCVKPC